MNMKPWQHASLSAGLTLVMVGLLFFVLIWPALSSRAAFNDRLDELQFQYRKFTATAANIPRLKQELEALAGLETDQTGFLEEKPRALAAADLQQLLRSLIEETGGSLISTQVMPDAGGERIFPEISVKVHMRANIRSFQQLLHKIHSGQPLLLMDSLLAQKRQRRTTRAQREMEQLEIRFDITAFIYQSGLS